MVVGVAGAWVDGAEQSLDGLARRGELRGGVPVVEIFFLVQILGVMELREKTVSIAIYFRDM
jgi:hypothetical protein